MYFLLFISSQFVTENQTLSEPEAEMHVHKNNDQGPVDQSIVSLMSLLVVKMLTALVSTVSNSQLFLLKKCE